MKRFALNNYFYGDIASLEAAVDDWHSVLESIVERYGGYDIIRFFRGDTAFADPNIRERVYGQLVFKVIDPLMTRETR